MSEELELSDQEKLSHIKDVVNNGRENIMRTIADLSLIDLDTPLLPRGQDTIMEVIMLSDKSADLLWLLQKSITEIIEQKSKN